jgi:2-methylcitrate dehydratase PrpD
LASWATELEPSAADLALARRSLHDTVAVMVAARDHHLRPVFEHLSDAGRWAALAHVLDFDDLHLASTAHISAVCVPVALASGGDARAYLAGAGVMARLGTALGWKHYAAGWHTTCTAGAPAAAVAAAVARGLDAERTAVAIALAIPAAGGIKRAFGTSAKALQVGFAADAGVRAATLAEHGASADVGALDEWIGLVGGRPAALMDGDPAGARAIPGGLAIKLFPCCYALQRPLSALAAIPPVLAEHVRRIRVTTPASSVAPLIHSRPTTGLEGKFSLEYAVAAFLLDGGVDLTSFTDGAVQRPELHALMDLVEITANEDGDGLLAGEARIEIALDGGESVTTAMAVPPGAPGRAPTDEQLRAKLRACSGTAGDEIAALSWETAPGFLRRL